MNYHFYRKNDFSLLRLKTTGLYKAVCLIYSQEIDLLKMQIK